MVKELKERKGEVVMVTFDQRASRKPIGKMNKNSLT